MQHIWSVENVHLQDAWVTIGTFDGVHRGHQEIVRKMTAGAHSDGSPAVVLTFFPHPAVVLGKRNGPYYLSTPEERAGLLGEMGVDWVITHPFDLQLAGMTAEEFMTKVKRHLGLKQLWVGHDFALGRGREGNVSLLHRLGGKMGFQVHAFPPIELDGQIISSSQIRTWIMSGEIDQATRALGRPYRVSGLVVPGDGRGRTIGIPTANLETWENLVLPGIGVYACQARVNGLDGKIWGAVTNVGLRPTFEQTTLIPRVETYLLNFEADLYGKQVSLDFYARLRDEQRFSDAQALVAQIHVDIARAKEILHQI